MQDWKLEHVAGGILYSTREWYMFTSRSPAAACTPSRLAGVIVGMGTNALTVPNQ